MKKLLIILVIFALSCCKREENTELLLTDLVINMDENPLFGDSILDLTSVTEEKLEWAIISQSPINAVAIHDNEWLTVSLPDSFDFELYPELEVNLLASNMRSTEEMVVKIELNDIEIIYSGPDITFTKPDYGNIDLPENQDRITEKVWLTRGNFEGLYNIRSENSYNTNSPDGTKWAKGTTDNIANLEFKNWINAMDRSPKAQLDQNYTLHLVKEDIYLGIKFISWTDGRNDGGGGGFSYIRSTSN